MSKTAHKSSGWGGVGYEGLAAGNLFRIVSQRRARAGIDPADVRHDLWERAPLQLGRLAVFEIGQVDGSTDSRSRGTIEGAGFSLKAALLPIETGQEGERRIMSINSHTIGLEA